MTQSFIGSGLLSMLGGVHAPEFDGMQSFVLIKSLVRLLVPLVLVPTLVPRGSPSDTLAAMGSTLGRHESAHYDTATAELRQAAADHALPMDSDSIRLSGSPESSCADH